MLDLKALLTKILTSLVVEDVSSHFKFTFAWTAMHKSAYKIGNVIIFNLEGYAGTIVGGTNYTMVTIDEGYRPKANEPLTGHATNNGYVPQSIVMGWLWAGSGDISIRCSNGNGNYVFISGCYAVGGAISS